MLKIKRVLISVSDKNGLEELVKGLNEFGVEIISTGGTAKRIRELGIPVRNISDFTGMPEMLDGRVKTLHPKVHGALLSLRDNTRHMEQVKQFDIELIDMVVVNLYPFEKTIADPQAAIEEAIENIDIGGPSMLRSAAKNAQSVAVLCNPQRYDEVLQEMRDNNGALTPQTCRRLSVEVFERTGEYDRSIAAYLKTKFAPSEEKTILPDRLTLDFDKVQSLRYGENPHQAAAFYREHAGEMTGVVSARQLHGKELSFNNILDLDAALNIVKDFREPAANIIKHNNPCGAAVAKTLDAAYKDALECDPLSAFGSIIGLNRKVDIATAQAILNADFVECVIAPEFLAQALDMLRKKKNLRIMEMAGLGENGAAAPKQLDYKRVSGGLLVEEKDTAVISEASLTVVTKQKPSPEQIKSLLFAWTIVKHVKSNAIVLAQGTKTVGIGAGQMSRVESVIIAVRKAQERCRGAVLASDAFFPKPDAVEEAKRAGISAIIQPGGSIKDPEVIHAADNAGIAMVLTGIRHFKH
ncbi:MAG: bifunctional phosphoribosylaminoimidazolecarboxamide formyltransferase/IMP cyclohydrolase [Candidatus Omnitrophica bacterium]|nr:bifunctional phosphoribosylaminoimidazolecarboxamide formyltransferase/IMP cyclohydrolase [Candidatus Omnitrophota bacterium]